MRCMTNIVEICICGVVRVELNYYKLINYVIILLLYNTFYLIIIIIIIDINRIIIITIIIIIKYCNNYDITNYYKIMIIEEIIKSYF